MREHPFALLPTAFAIFTIGCRVAHLPWGTPLAEIAGLAWFAMHLFGIVSIFCDRTPWPGLLLFWASFFIRFI